VVRVQGAVYATYGLAAMVTAWLQRRWPSWAVALPDLVLLGVLAFGARHTRRANEAQSA
jgi:hypothetical protein